MIRNIITLSVLGISMLAFSFADFSSEYAKCDRNDKYTLCEQKIIKQYSVSKSNACKLPDGLYNKPISIVRPRANFLESTQFYKYNGNIYYPFGVSETIKLKNTMDETYIGNAWNSYLYSYSCKTKKSSVIDIHNSYIHWHNTTFAGEKINKENSLIGGFHFSTAQSNKVIMNIHIDGVDGDGEPFIYDILSKKLYRTDISTMKNFNKLQNTIDTKIHYLYDNTKRPYIILGYGSKGNSLPIVVSRNGGSSNGDSTLLFKDIDIHTNSSMLWSYISINKIPQLSMKLGECTSQEYNTCTYKEYNLGSIDYFNNVINIK